MHSGVCRWLATHSILFRKEPIRKRSRLAPLAGRDGGGEEFLERSPAIYVKGSHVCT